MQAPKVQSLWFCSNLHTKWNDRRLSANSGCKCLVFVALQENLKNPIIETLYLSLVRKTVCGCHAEINDSSVGGSLDFCVLNTSCRHVPLLLGCSGWKPQLCFFWFEGFPTRLLLSVFFCLSTGMQSVQGSCLKNLSVSSGTAFFLLWNEKNKVSKLPTNQN